MKKKLWKIRNKETGQFSKGGHHSNYYIWSKDGKTWSNIGHVKNHLRVFMNNGEPDRYYPYHNAEIVEIEVDYAECNVVDVDKFIIDELRVKRE